jgi:OmpA-OmpF porin, OOP family
MISRLPLLILALLPVSCAATQGVNGGYDPASPQEVEWFHSGWYVGATMGTAVADASASELDDDLADLGYDTESSLDDSDVGWKIFGGYRFEKPWAVELAIVDLGVVESKIDVSGGITEDFLDDLTDVHPYSGAGASLTGTYFPLVTDRFEAGIKAGVWYWEAEVDANAATGEDLGFDESKVHPLLGIVGNVDVSDSFAVRVEWEHYVLDENDVDYFAIGLQYTIR